MKPLLLIVCALMIIFNVNAAEKSPLINIEIWQDKISGELYFLSNSDLDVVDESLTFKGGYDHKGVKYSTSLLSDK